MIASLVMYAGLPAQDAKGYALLVGLSTVDNDAYQGKWRRTYGTDAVSGINRDLSNMTKILQGYELRILLNEDATNSNVLSEIRKIGKAMKPGDTFVLYFSGHGDVIPDKNGDEPDQLDEVLVTYNDYVVDDSLQVLFTKLFTKTHNIMIVDACHSSSSYKNLKGSMHDFAKLSLRGKPQFMNEALVLEKEAMAQPCAYEQTTEVNEPYPLIYFGATGDYSKALGDNTGGLLTKNMYNYYQHYKNNHILPYLSYQELACKIGNSFRSGFQVLQYHEIGPISDKLKNNIPFKIINL